MIIHKTTAVGLTEFCGRPDPQAISAAAWIAAMGERLTPLPPKVVRVSNPSIGSIGHVELYWDEPKANWHRTIVGRFAQCGYTTEKMAFMLQQVLEPKIVNLNASYLSLAVSLAIKSM